MPFHLLVQHCVKAHKLYTNTECNDVFVLTVLVVLQSIEGAIGGSAYQAQKVNNWTSDVVELCLGQLTKLGKPFKYIGI